VHVKRSMLFITTGCA